MADLEGVGGLCKEHQGLERECQRPKVLVSQR